MYEYDDMSASSSNASSSSASAAAADLPKIVGCRRYHANFVAAYGFIYFSIYYWFRVIFIHLIPCSVLVVFNTLLLVTMRQAQQRRRQLLAQVCAT